MGFLSLAQITAAQARPCVTVAAPEMGAGAELRVRLPHMGAITRLDDLREKVAKHEAGEADIGILMLQEALVDADGNPLCASREDAAKVYDAIPPMVMKRVTSAFFSLDSQPKGEAKLETPEEGKSVPGESGSSATV